MSDPRPASPAPGPTRLLLVDDSLLVQRMVREYFEPAGYEVLTAGNGQEALERVRERAPDVIIADIIMPVMDGWEFCEAIRREPATADIPFLFLTAVREVPKRIQGLRMGADDYVTKPFSREELLARVEVCLAKLERLRRLQAGAVALSGDTAHLPVPDLLQFLGLNGKSGELRLATPAGQPARVFFRNGQVVDARIGKVEGLKALYRILDLPAGRFDLDPGAPVPDGAAIRESTSNALMEACTHNDEMRRLREKLPRPDERFQIARELRGRADDLAVHEKAVLTEFDPVSSLDEVLDRSPLSDLEVARAVLKLLDLDLLRPA
jgi:CheY-like chemotaxis protein